MKERIYRHCWPAHAKTEIYHYKGAWRVFKVLHPGSRDRHLVGVFSTEDRAKAFSRKARCTKAERKRGLGRRK